VCACMCVRMRARASASMVVDWKGALANGHSACKGLCAPIKTTPSRTPEEERALLLCTVAVLWNAGSAYPSAGSVYHWAGQLASEQRAPLASYVTGEDTVAF
jgi:hypothetical protein